MRFLQICQTGFLAIALATLANDALAATQQWDGSSNNVFGNPFNWTPFGIPGDGDTATITGGTPNSIPVILLSDTDALDGLTVNGGAQLRTNGHQLLVDDTLFSFPIQFDNSHTLVGAAANLVVNSGAVDALVLPTTDFRADFVTIANNGAVTLLSPTSVAEPAKFRADRTISNLAGGFLRGSGIIQLGGLLNNDGTLASLTGDLTVDPAPSGPAGTADLDGANEIGIVSVAADTTLTINAMITDSIDGQISIADGGRLKIAGDARIGSSNASFGSTSDFAVTGNLTFGRADDGTPANFDHRGTTEGRIEVGDAAEFMPSVPFEIEEGIVVADTTENGGHLTFTQGAEFATDSSMQIGYRNHGFLLVEEGAVLNQAAGIFSGIARIGSKSGGEGEAVVTGVGSQWNARNIAVGPSRGSVGLLEVLDDAEVNTFVLSAGAEGATEGTIRVNDAALNVADRTVFSFYGESNVRVENGGSLKSVETRIADYSIGNGTVTITDSGSSWTIDGDLDMAKHPGGTLRAGSATLTVENDAETAVSGDLSLGGNASGWIAAELYIRSGALFEADGNVIVVKDLVSTGTSLVSLEDGELRTGSFRNEDGFTNAGNSIIRAGLAGTLSLTIASGSTNQIEGGLTFEGDSLIEAGAAFGGSGTLRNNAGHVMNLDNGANLSTVLLKNAGELRIGDLTSNLGEANVAYLAMESDSSLLIDLAGTADGSFDTLIVDSDAEIGGDLAINLLSFIPQAGDSFEVLTTLTGNVIGTFSEVIQPLPGSIRFDVTYNTGSVVLNTFLSADVDADGDVDGADFLLIQRTDPALISIWETQYGSVSTAAVGSVSVPEPATLLLLLLSLAGCVVRSPVRCYSY